MREAARIGKGALVAKDIDKHTIAAFGMQPIDRLVEDLIVVHSCFPMPAGRYAGALRDGARGLKHGVCERFALERFDLFDPVTSKGRLQSGETLFFSGKYGQIRRFAFE